MQVTRVISVILIACAFSLTLSPLAETASQSNRCIVTDPSGTPLNVRNSPGGRVTNRLRNGREVFILKMDYDNRGRPWAYVSGDYKGHRRNWGWVFRQHISCSHRAYTEKNLFIGTWYIDEERNDEICGPAPLTITPNELTPLEAEGEHCRLNTVEEIGKFSWKIGMACKAMGSEIYQHETHYFNIQNGRSSPMRHRLTWSSDHFSSTYVRCRTHN